MGECSGKKFLLWNENVKSLSICTKMTKAIRIVLCGLKQIQIYAFCWKLHGWRHFLFHGTGIWFDDLKKYRRIGCGFFLLSKSRRSRAVGESRWSPLDILLFTFSIVFPTFYHPWPPGAPPREDNILCINSILLISEAVWVVWVVLKVGDA